MLYSDIFPILTLLGAIIGAAIPNVITYYSNKRAIRDQSQHSTKEGRYKALLFLMYAMLDFDNQKENLLKHGRNFNDIGSLKDELLAELTFATLYASDSVILNLKSFIKNPTEDSYLKATVEMRKDLYNLKTKLTVSDLKINI